MAKALKCSLMDPYMKVSSLMGIVMARVEESLQEVKCIKGSLNLMLWKVKGFINGPMVECMKAIGKLERKTVWVNSSGLMDKSTTVNLKTTNAMETVCYIMRMVKN